LGASDDFSFRPAVLEAADNFSPALSARQRSHHLGLRHRLALGGRHWVESLITDVEIDRRRFGYEPSYLDLKPDIPRSYVLDDRRVTHRQTRRVEGQSRWTDRLAVEWGAESSRERTRYRASNPFELGFDHGGRERYSGWQVESQTGIFGQATWRPRADLTATAGLRWDDSELAGDAHLAPRASLHLRHGRGVWRASWARVMSVPATHELSLVDGESALPGSEITGYRAVSYLRSSTRGQLAVEIHQQRIADPRRRFVNLYKPISRIPELELDRIRLDSEAARLEGLEVRAGARGDRWQSGASYQLGRAEDLVDGRWRPRRSDRRHRLDAWMYLQLADDLRADLRWYGATGFPTTPFDAELFDPELGSLQAFARAIGAQNSRRLPPEHQLDLRLELERRWRGLTVTLEGGIDNVYDRRHVRGFSLVSSTGGEDVTLAAELASGRRFRWGVELAW
ncbi:MAG: TonB-dependent receptor, partial [Holophagales bacterium]|nr:TonB-dependent receptor [Holophagales bacterium]